jgi:hypothetical protein
LSVHPDFGGWPVVDPAVAVVPPENLGKNCVLFLANLGKNFVQFLANLGKNCVQFLANFIWLKEKSS